MDVPMELSRILITELGDQQVIFLKEKAGPRSMPIVIGLAEALAIDRRIKGQPTPRPMTHDLLANVIMAMGGALEKIVIHDLRHHVFLARLHIRLDGRRVEVDSRPSDAIALGAALDTPIYVADHVLEEASKDHTSRQQRLDLLRERLSSLDERIAELEDLLRTPDFVNDMPPAVVDEHRRQLEQMQAERQAIAHVLKKLG